ncbi:MAG: serine/threonine-protein phosphatase [Akkermansiaceae bacterium]|nr:serine/threonine-protein phosphatase [Akkermansiaceae bacterium]MCP5551139.1 serine/threonine-protein phosphatase [Akkermansiaceae bacterium]
MTGIDTSGAAAALLRSGRDYAGRQWRGSRDYQEDSYAVAPPEELGEGRRDLLIVLADGMGGHAAGDVASRVGVERFIHTFYESEDEPDDSRMAMALEAANRQIGAEAERLRADSMGTTLLAVLVRGRLVEWISVGDSPLFLVRDGRIGRLNADHSMSPVIDRMIEESKITDEEIADLPPRNELRSALIGEEIDLIDTPGEPFALEPGDVLVAASDGVLTAPPLEIAKAVSKTATQDASRIAIAVMDAVVSHRKAKQDNLTVVVFKFDPSPED